LNLYHQPEFCEQHPILSGSEAHHVLSVMRLQPGEKIQVTNGKGTIFKCTLASKTGSECRLSIQEIEHIPQPTYKIHIALAIIKASDRMEWFVEKATEIGVQKISFITATNCERKTINLDRLKRVAISAIKQSGQAWLPVLSGPDKFESVIENQSDERYIGYIPEHQQVINLISIANTGKSYLVLIGPEGDFTETKFRQAIKNGFQPVSLGHQTLRSETAALSACQILNLVQLKS
jgi:16S rRNA (uracil1498-N3)-methyltransferase